MKSVQLAYRFKFVIATDPQGTSHPKDIPIASLPCKSDLFEVDFCEPGTTYGAGACLSVWGLKELAMTS